MKKSREMIGTYEVYKRAEITEKQSLLALRGPNGYRVICRNIGEDGSSRDELLSDRFWSQTACTKYFNNVIGDAKKNADYIAQEVAAGRMIRLTWGRDGLRSSPQSLLLQIYDHVARGVKDDIQIHPRVFFSKDFRRLLPDEIDGVKIGDPSDIYNYVGHQMDEVIRAERLGA